MYHSINENVIHVNFVKDNINYHDKKVNKIDERFRVSPR